MITRFDHAVIAVPDVAAAIEAYRALGFETSAGGRHPSIGTANGIVRFGLDYLELLAVEDHAQAQASGAFGAGLDDFLALGSGLVGFVLASNDLDAEGTALERVGQDHVGPFAMDRERPDGRRLAWRLVIPGGSPWRKLWPFLIEWETPDRERLAWDAVGQHDNGCRGVAGLELVVNDVSDARRFYEQGLGLVDVADSGTQYRLGDFSLSLAAATDAARRDELERLGPGPYCLDLRCADLAHAARLCGGTPRDGVLELDPDAALGARIRLLGDQAPGDAC